MDFASNVMFPSSTLRPLKVVFYEPFGRGGICHYTFQLANALAQMGTKVTVITNDPYELQSLPRYFTLNTQLAQTYTKQFLTRLILPLKSALSTKKISSLNGAARSHSDEKKSKRELALRRWIRWLELVACLLVTRPAIVHLQWLFNPREDRFFIYILKLLGFKVIYTAHNIVPHTPHSATDVRMLSKLYKCVDTVLVHAHSNKQTLMDDFGLRPDKISVIPHGSYDLFYSQNSLLQSDARSRLGIPLTRPIVLFFGIIRRYKGLEYLVSAFDKVSREIKGALLLIVGMVPEDNPEDYRYYSNLLEGLSVRHDLIFRSQYTPWDTIGQYFVAADVIALPYVQVYQSGILLSAYAAGRPVVVTDVGGLSEVVEHGNSGFVVPVKNSDALAEAIVTLLRDPELCKRMGCRAAQLAQQKYSWKEIAQQTNNLYRTFAIQQ